MLQKKKRSRLFDIWRNMLKHRELGLRLALCNFMEVLYDGVVSLSFLLMFSFQLSFVIDNYKSLNLYLKNLSVSPNVGMFTLQFVGFMIKILISAQ